VDSLRNPTVVRDGSGLEALRVRPAGVREAIAATLGEEDRNFQSSRWSALADHERAHAPGRYLADARALDVAVPAARAFEVIERIGGANGWYYADWLWRLRGALDRAAGGVGLRRVRSDPRRLRVRDRVDFWRIEELEPGRRVRFAAEMKVPGRAWLEFEVIGGPAGSRIHQTAVFEPRGLGGLAYWYALTPAHALVFRGMLRRIAGAALQAAARAVAPGRP